MLSDSARQEEDDVDRDRETTTKQEDDVDRVRETTKQEEDDGVRVRTPELALLPLHHDGGEQI